MKKSMSKMTEEQKTQIRQGQEKHTSLKEDVDQTVRLVQLSREERARVLAIIQGQKKEPKMHTMQVLERLPETPVPEVLLETPQEEDNKTFRLPKRALRPLWHLGFNDAWLRATFFTACIASVVSLCYFFLNHQILLMNDSYSHMLIARRVFDNSTPGIAQLGGIWLPLPHLLMMPFIWNDYLWRTGLAGSFSTMPCYVIAAIYLFLAARRLTHNSRASFVGTMLFILNPNVLYLQTTPLGELVYIATLTMASYYFLAWAQEEKLNYLILAAASTFLATLTRYDGWAIFIVFLVCIVLIGWLKRQHRSLIEANLLIFGILGGLGIVLWILWNTIIFHDALYFQRSEFSSQAQQKTLPQQLQYLHTKVLITYHELWQSIHSYSLDAIYNVGLILFILALIAVIVFFFRRCITSEMLAASIFLVPFPFYVFALYTAQAVIFVPGAAPAHAPLNITFYNVRYGVEIVAPAAVFLATLANWQVMHHWLKGRGQVILQIVLSLAIIIQTLLIAYGGIITLQDSQYGLDCALLHPVVVYLVQHYDGGRIMEDTFTSATSLPSDVGIDFKDIVYEGSGELWKQALRDPASEVNWLLANPTDAADLVAQHINVNNQQFLSQFTPVVQQGDGLILFHRSGLPPLPAKPITPGLLTAHRLCNIGKFLPL